jgi:long-chain acyl-CoA synthetase
LSSYETHPWTQYYTAGTQEHVSLEYASVGAAFQSSVDRFPDVPLVHYFNRTFTVRQIDDLADALAAALADRQVAVHDRIAIYMQNMPQFTISAIATWKLGGIIVPLNPMLRERELRHQLRDSGATVLICLESLYNDVALTVIPDTEVRTVITTSPLDWQDRHDLRIFADLQRYDCLPALDFQGLLTEYTDAHPPPISVSENDVAILAYTSGTTGIPKAAMNTHSNVLYNAQSTRDWMQLTPKSKVLGLAPLFHITGLICQLTTSLVVPAPLILSYRFDPEIMLSSIRDYGPTFAIGAVTAFVGILAADSFTREDFASFERIYSGGAPVSPATARQFEEATGYQLHGAFGMTESSAPTHFSPFNVPAPVDTSSGALTIGIPTPGTMAWIVDDSGKQVGPGEQGELVIAGPQVASGYWHRPEETAAVFREGKLVTGDIAIMDSRGWFYIVDRKKDVIISSGYKIWPREVEDVLYEHPMVREVAVVGVPDAYRGETVKAVVSLYTAGSVEPKELIEFVGQRLSAYKRPTLVEIIPDLPKTLTGKILRREVRRL